MKILDDELIDDLQNSYYILQKKNSFKFGTDAVLLADFAKDGAGARVLDLCTGTGIVAILLAAKTDAAEIYGIEIQEDMADMASRSVEYNNLTSRVKMVHGDLKEAEKYFKPHSFDTVTCNPPYMKLGKNIKNELSAKMIARHECLCTLDDVVRTAAGMLKYHGSFYMVHRPSRLIDIISTMRAHSLEPKVLRFVHPYAAKEPVMVLVKGVYQGGEELRILPPLNIYNECGEYCDELKQIYSSEGAK